MKSQNCAIVEIIPPSVAVKQNLDSAASTHSTNAWGGTRWVLGDFSESPRVRAKICFRRKNIWHHIRHRCLPSPEPNEFSFYFIEFNELLFITQNYNFFVSFILHFDCFFFVSLAAASFVLYFFGWCVTSIKHGQRQKRSLWIVWPLASSIHFTPNTASSIFSV